MISFELNTHKLRNRTQKGSEMCLWEGMKEKWQHQVSNTGLLIKLMLPPLDHNYLWLLTLTSMERGSCFHCMRKDPELIPKMQELVIMISFSLKRAFRKKWTEREKLDPLLIAPQDSVHFSVPVLQFTNIPGIVGDPPGIPPQITTWNGREQANFPPASLVGNGKVFGCSASYMPSIWQTLNFFFFE